VAKTTNRIPNPLDPGILKYACVGRLMELTYHRLIERFTATT
jgi:hypothetical protein